MARTAKIFDVRDGEVLLADATDAAGNVLLARGAVLSARQAQLLAKRGVETVEVGAAEEAQSDSDAPSAEDLAAALQRLDAAFEGLAGDELMEAIRRASRARIGAGKLGPR